MIPGVANFDLLEFPKMFQMELLRHLVEDEQFFYYAEQILQVEDFDYPPCQTIYDALQAYYHAQRQKPHFESLRIAAYHFAETGGRKTVALRPEEVPAFHAVFHELQSKIGAPLDSGYYRAKLTAWIKRVRWNAILRDNQTVNPASLDHMLQQATELDALGSQMDDGDNFSTPFDHTPPIDAEDVFRIRTGLAKLDRRTHGGLGIGELGMVLACPGVGKTTTLLNLANAAVMQRFRALFITCEMASHRIAHRYQSILAYIYAHTLRDPMRGWPMADIERWQLAKQHLPRDGITIYDASKGPHSISQIDQTIKRWRENMFKKYGDDAYPVLVCLDWLHPDYLTLPGAREKKSHEVMASLSKNVGIVGRNNDVALWSACQANKGADGKETLMMRDTAGAYDINQALDVGIALAPIKEFTQAQKTMLTQSADDDDKQADALIKNGRRLSVNSTKNRDNPPFKIEVYQGPTLQFWDKKELWVATEERLRRDNGAQLIKENLGVV